MQQSDFKVGDVVNNGFYHIEIIEQPRWNDTHERWMARGYRWVASRKDWEAKPKLYGWRETFPVTL